jgi:hypothetical protein
MVKYKIFAGAVIVIVVCGLIFYIQSPRLQARSMLVDAVGEDYLNSFMELRGVQYASFLPPKSTVVYDYHIQVGNYSTTCEAIFIFDWMDRLRYSRGVPPSDNLMPFNVTQEEAINIAQKQVTQRHLEVEAEILFLEYIHDVPLNRYVWFVRVYLTEKSAISGTVIVVFIDLHSSEIIDVAETCWTST